MFISKLQLQHLRRFENSLFEFEAPITLVMGKNGLGKSTILEALYLGSAGVSPRTSHAGELVAFGQELGRAAVLLKNSDKLGVTVTTGNVGGRRTNSKLFTINEAKKRQKDFVGQYLAVIFRPEDMRLIEGSPGRRRDYLDMPLSVTNWEYAHALDVYAKALLRRNKLLSAIRDGEVSRNPADNNIEYWNDLLLESGQIIQTERQKYLDFINQTDSELGFFAYYDHSLMTRERLDKYAQAEMAVGHTLVGPHKDELIIKCKLLGENELVDVADFGSRGQQRLAVLWLKMGELRYLETKKSDQPLLLLDDILSELDEEARANVLDLTANYQTIITTTEEAVVELLQERNGKLQLIRLD